MKTEEQMSNTNSVDVIIDGQRYEFSRYELGHLADSLTGNARGPESSGAVGWRDLAENERRTLGPEAGLGARELAEAHERLAQAFNDAGRGRATPDRRGIGR